MSIYSGFYLEQKNPDLFHLVRHVYMGVCRLDVFPEIRGCIPTKAGVQRVIRSSLALKGVNGNHEKSESKHLYS